MPLAVSAVALFFAAELLAAAQRDPSAASTAVLLTMCAGVLVQFVVILWFWIEVGFLRCTYGPSRFGADPLR